MRIKAQGCPATLVFLNPTRAHINAAIGIYANAPHPHAATLFVDFMKSADGAKILAATGPISGHRGVKALYEEISNFGEGRSLACGHAGAVGADRQADATES